MRWTPYAFVAFLVAGAIIYPLYATHNLAIWFGAIAQIVGLVFAAYNATLAWSSYGKKDEPRKAWSSLALGLWIWVLAQFMEAYCDLVLKIIAYGTIADAFWFLGYLPMIYGIWLLVRSYRNTGLPLGSRSSNIIHLVLLVAAFAFVFYFFIFNQLMDPKREIVNKLLDVSYPTMDFILVCLISFLIRFAWMLRGGQVARALVFLCAGFLLVGVADLWLSYATDFESAFYRLNDLTYYSAYFLIAIAGMYQYRVLKTA